MRRNVLSSRLLSIGICVALLGVAGSVAPAAAQTIAPVATLTGEVLTAADRTNDATGTFNSQVSCNADGTGSIAFQVAGVAFGPYPGTYTEQGVATFGPTLAFPMEGLSAVTSFTATFKIVSGRTEITGTKQLSPSAVPTLAYGGCGVGRTTDVPQIVLQAGQATYSATIVTANGTFHDEGTTSTSVVDYTVDPNANGTHHETFASTLTEASPIRVAPGNSPLQQRGKGCGDRHHAHVRAGDCHSKA